MRVYLGVNRYAPLLGIIGDMGWVPGNVRRKIDTVRLWNRLVNMNENRITKKIFVNDYNLDSERTWCSGVKSIFNEIDESTVFESLKPYDLNILKEKLMEYYHNVWPHQVQNKPKLRFYRRFKREPNVEDYIKLRKE